MRRLLAILLLAVFGLTTATPLLAATQDATHSLDAHLPACCRRNGAHHCMMAVATDTPSVSARCTQCPHPWAVASHMELLASSSRISLLQAPCFLTTASSKAEQQRRLSRERTRQKRGPPAVFFAA